MLQTSTPILRVKPAPFCLPRRSYQWRRESRKYPLSSRCSQPPTSRVVAHCSTPIGVGASWLWCLRRKSFSDFLKHPSASRIPNVAQELFVHTGREAVENSARRLFPSRKVSMCQFGCCVIRSINIAPDPCPGRYRCILYDQDV